MAAVLKGWSRNLLVFESFASAPQGTFRCCKSFPCWRGIFACWRGISRAIELLFFMDSKGNVRRVFLACVLHALGWNPAGARVFRNCASKGHLPMVLLGYKRSARNISWLQEFSLLETSFFGHSVGNVRASALQDFSCWRLAV